MTALAHLAPHATVERRPGPAVLVRDQVRYAFRGLWRARIVLVFTFVLPIVWLTIIGLVAGNDAVDEASGVRVMQFATPMALVMAAVFAAYPPVAMGLGLAREQRILKRLRGTPLPMAAYVAGQVGAATLLAAVAIVLMLALGVVQYGVQVQWPTVPATLVTLGLGIASLAALGLAVGALAPAARTAQTTAVASAVALLFVSGMMTVGSTTPAWMDTIGWVFPVRPLFVALRDQFNPFLAGGGWNLGALAVIGAWGLGGAVVASWALNREPTLHGARRRAAPPVPPTPEPGRPTDHAGRLTLTPSETGRLGRLALLLDQVRWDTRGTLRDRGNIVFAIGMPVALYALVSSMYPSEDLYAGVPLVRFFACGMAAYGAGVTAFVNLPVAVARARDRGILKRLHGTPLATWLYLTGRTASALWISVLTAALVFAVGIAVFRVEVPIERVPVALAVFALGTLTLAACGFAVMVVVPGARAAAVIGLSILLPLSFFSDVFLVSGGPDWMATVGSIFPLRHFVHALDASLDPAAISVAWTDIGVITAWLVGASVVAVRRFRWEAKV